MALKATVVKAELQVSDLDRHHYATYPLTLAQHPSETDARLMLRLVAFALFADERLAFGRGLGSDDEPDLWQTSLSGEIERWIELGQPDESRLRKACGRARDVVVLGYGGRGFAHWWERHADGLARCGNLSVLEVPAATVGALATLYGRNLRLQALIEDRALQLLGEAGSVDVQPIVHRTAATAPR